MTPGSFPTVLEAKATMKVALAGALLGLSLGCTQSQDLGGRGSGLAAFAGAWDGYIENYAFPSGSDRVQIQLRLAGKTLTGTVLFGGDAPPPLSPTTGYPPGLREVHTELDTPLEALPYTVYQPELAADRLSFRVAALEPWKAWCATQLPPSDPEHLCLNCATARYEDGVTCTYQCAGGVETPTDCGRLTFCQEYDWVCDCTESGCSQDTERRLNLDVDMAVRGEFADGSITVGRLHNLRLTAVP